MSLDATGLGPCDTMFPYSCAYMIRLDGPAGYEHYGWFDWDYATKQPTSSTGVVGDLPTTLGPGIWTFSFGFVHRSDLVSYMPVPDGTPRSNGFDPREVGCTQRLVVGGEISDQIHVAFSGDRCKVLVVTAIP